MLSGTAAVPLLLVKLWTVYPKLFARPPRAGPRAGAARRSSGPRSRSWSPRRSSSWPSGLANTAAVVPVGVLLPRHPLRGRLGGDRRPAGPRRGEAAGDPPRAGRRRRRPRPGPSDGGPAGPVSRRGAGPHRAGSRPGWPCSPPPAAPCRGCARSRCSACGRGDGPGGVPINKSAQAADVVAAALSPDYRLVVAHAGTRASAQPRRAAATAAAHRGCRSPASRAGAPRRLDRRAAARPARPGRRAARQRRAGRPRCSRTGRSG